MPKSAVAVIALIIIFTGHLGWAQLSPDQEKRLKELEAKEEAWDDWEVTGIEEEEIPRRLKNIEKERENQQIEKRDFSDSPSGGSVGRYQAVRMDSNAIFILDTMEGHLWVWVIQKDSSGQSAEFLFYQGRVKPGSNMGEIIDRTYKNRPERSDSSP